MTERTYKSFVRIYKAIFLAVLIATAIILLIRILWPN